MEPSSLRSANKRTACTAFTAQPAPAGGAFQPFARQNHCGSIDATRTASCEYVPCTPPSQIQTETPGISEVPRLNVNKNNAEDVERVAASDIRYSSSFDNLYDMEMELANINNGDDNDRLSINNVFDRPGVEKPFVLLPKRRLMQNPAE